MTKMRMFGLVVANALAIVLPRRAKPTVYRLLKWEIDRSAFIGASLILVANVEMGPGSRIGHGNVIKGCDSVRLSERSRIGILNWISGPGSDSSLYPTGTRHPQLLLGRESSILSRHLIDCTDTVILEDFAVLAGNRSQVLTHEPDIAVSEVRTAPVIIGSHSVVFTASVLTAGAVVPANSVVAAGAVVVPGLEDEFTLYAGVPARSVKSIDPASAYFHKT